MARARKTPEEGAKGAPSSSEEEHVEFAQANLAHACFDRAAWDAAVTHRREMPSLTAAAFDPGPGALPKHSRTVAAFLADDDHPAARTRSAKILHDPVGLVRAVAVGGRSDFMPGTLVVRVREQDVEGVDPRTLHLLRWDDVAETYSIVDVVGFDVEHGYIWGRITRPGIYGVFGLPDPQVFETRDSHDTLSLLAIRLVFERLFSATGEWESLGPVNLSCCMLDLAIDPGDNDRLYAAAADGGVWRLQSVSRYPTVSWTPLTDHQPSLVIACVAVSPADGRVVYYVDDLGRLFRSTDRGENWTLTSGTNLGAARRLLLHPSDANTVFVASSTGVWCSHTGGTTWASNAGQTTLLDGDMTDMAIDPGNTSILFAAQRSTGVLRSGDDGATWTTVLPWSSARAPAGTMIKVAVGGQGTDANRTVAAKLDQEVFVNRTGGRSPLMTGGGPWTSLGMGGGNGYGDWCHAIAVDPFDDNSILAGAQQLMRTSDGGANWSTVIDYYAPHEDQHRVVFDATQRGVVYAANDGGVFRSTDGGTTWQTSGDDVVARRDLTRGLVTAQFYTAGVSGEHAVADAYHQGLIGADALRLGTWQGIEGHGWERNNVYGDPSHAGRYYVFGATLYRRTFFGPGTGALVQIGSFSPSAIAVDRRPGSAVLVAGTTAGQVMRATDGDSDTPNWAAMSGMALASGDKVVSFDLAPSRPQRACALAASGRVFVCADIDSSSSWTEVTALPQPGVALAVSVEDERRVFAISGGSVFRTTNGATTAWTSVPGTGTNALPPDLSLRSIVAGPNNVFVAAASGIFRSLDAGQTWFPFVEGLPNVQIMELLWTEGDLFAVTHGRGLWHHGWYRPIPILGPVAHKPDIRWLIELWLAIHGGDPAPQVIRERIGRSIRTASMSRDARRGAARAPTGERSGDR